MERSERRGGERRKSLGSASACSLPRAFMKLMECNGECEGDYFGGRAQRNGEQIQIWAKKKGSGESHSVKKRMTPSCIFKGVVGIDLSQSLPSTTYFVSDCLPLVWVQVTQEVS